MKRVFGLILCLVLIVMGSCSLFDSYKEMNTSSLDDSGGTEPGTPEEAIALVNDFLGITVEEEIASLSPDGDHRDVEGALKAYLQSKISKPKAAEMGTFAFNVDLGYKGPAGDNGTADVKGNLNGVLPYDGLYRDLLADTDYSFTGLITKLVLSGDLKKLGPLGDYSLVHGKLKNDCEFNTDVNFTTDEYTNPDETTLKGDLKLKLKMSNGFSVKNTVSGQGVKFTIVANNDVSKKWENLISGGNTALEDFMKEIKFTISVYNDADRFLGSEELSLYDLLMQQQPV